MAIKLITLIVILFSQVVSDDNIKKIKITQSHQVAKDK